MPGRPSFRERLQTLVARVSEPQPQSVFAEERAAQLLLSNLSPSQRTQYSLFRYFDVIGGDTGRRYRIRHGSLMNVEQLDGKAHLIKLLCFRPRGWLPLGDIMLAQKVALENFEKDALKVANRAAPWDPCVHS
jgi:hypothetical protein